MDKIISQTKYSRKQHKEFYKFHVIRRSGTLKFLGFIIAIMFVIALSNTFTADFKIQEDTSGMIFAWMMFGVSVMITPLMILRKINSVVKNETPERVQSTEKVEVTKIKFVRTNDTLEGKQVFGWTDIQVLCETDKYFYVYLSDDNGIFIVKEDIVEGSVELFKKYALANLKKDKKGRPVYKRYGQVKKEYKALKKIEKKNKKLGIGK